MSALTLGAVLVAVLLLTLLAWRLSPPSRQAEAPSEGLVLPAEFPASGLLVDEEVLRSVGSRTDAVWDALEVAATPVAIEYRPVSSSEIGRSRVMPVSAADKQAIEQIIEALKPRGETLFKVTLPKGATLVKAAGTNGYRGFSRTAGKTKHAVLTPVSLGGRAARSLPTLGLSAAVLAVDVMAQREQLAYQRKVEALLERQDEHYYLSRIKEQRSADVQLSRAISQILDGRAPNLELALKSAHDEFLHSQSFLKKHANVLEGLVDEDGRVDYHQLEERLGGKTKEIETFIRELHLSRSAMAIQRKALVADAAASALADPANPYLAFQSFLDSEVQQLEQAEAKLSAFSEQLVALELKGRWHNREKSVAGRQTHFRELVSPPPVEETNTERSYVVTAEGEILQLMPSDEQLEVTEGSTGR